jgi:hypothetical protein
VNSASNADETNRDNKATGDDVEMGTEKENNKQRSVVDISEIMPTPST